ncbi:hypothetical protein BGW80DRAFT_1272466 [Lactifluus volemus]|nr:hypothetical protein BGW80DRAFT_1272466 [Lactifluus volemus]
MKRRVLSSLLTGVEFSTPEHARKATDVIQGTVHGLCEGLAHKLPTPKSKNQNAESMQELSVPLPPRTPPRRTEPGATLETHKAYICGSIAMLAVTLRRTGIQRSMS